MTNGNLACVGWQSALRHFSRLLIECGSPLELEHAQRVGLLFSRIAGCAKDVCAWASLFSAEGLPACSLMLKALVVNDQWRRAVELVEMDLQTHDTVRLHDILAQFLVARGMWSEALSTAHAAVRFVDVTNLHRRCATLTTSSVHSSCNSSALLDEAIRAAGKMASDALYVPRGESAVYCGLGSVVYAAFPRNVQWRAATEMLATLCRTDDEELRCKLREYWAARLVYGGAQYASYLRWWRECEENKQRRSLTLRRVALFSALMLRDVNASLDLAESLCGESSSGVTAVPLHMIVLLCTLANSADIDDRIASHRVARLAQRHVLLLQQGKCARYAPFLMASCGKRSILATVAGQTGQCYSALRAQQAAGVPIQNLSDADVYITRLVTSGQWREALDLMRIAASVKPCNDNERTLVTLMKSHASDWRAALLLFH